MSTTNYEFITPVGSDIVNLLTQSNPNWVKADVVIKGVSDHAVGVATELKTGTVHALTRSTGSEDRDVFVFVATTNFVAGETFLLDNEQVTALTASGEQLATGCYVIGSSVLVVKKGTLLTFFVPESKAKDSDKLGGELPSHYATQADLGEVQTDLEAVETKVGTEVLTTTAQTCSGGINELNSNLTGMTLVGSSPASSSGYATVTGVNAKISGCKMIYMQATINTNFFSVYVPTNQLVSGFNPTFRTGAENTNVQFTYIYGVNGGQIQLNEFAVDGVEYNTNGNTNLTIYAMN